MRVQIVYILCVLLLAVILCGAAESTQDADGNAALPVRGLYVQFERRGWAAEYWSGQVIRDFNTFDSVVGSTVAEEVELQLLHPTFDIRGQCRILKQGVEDRRPPEDAHLIDDDQFQKLSLRCPGQHDNGVVRGGRIQNQKVRRSRSKRSSGQYQAGGRLSLWFEATGS